MLPKKLLDLIDRIDQLVTQVAKVLARVDEMIDLLKSMQPSMQAQASASPAQRTGEQLAEQLDWDTYTVPEILERLPSLKPAERKLLAQYEKDNKNRVSIVRALEEMDAAA